MIFYLGDDEPHVNTALSNERFFVLQTEVFF